MEEDVLARVGTQALAEENHFGARPLPTAQTARAIESALRSAGYVDVRCVAVPQEGVAVLRVTQHLG